MEEMVIRLAVYEDVPQITGLAKQLGYPATEEDMGCRLAELIQQANHAVWVAAMPDSNVVGWIHIYVHRSLLQDPVMRIGGLVVDVACRGRDIGRQLLEYAEKWAEARGCDAVVVKSNVTRQEAHGFYEHMGYENVKTQYNFRKNLHHDQAGCL